MGSQSPILLSQQHSRFVGDQRCRQATAQCLAGQLHDRHQKGAGIGDADHLVQPVADPEGAVTGGTMR